MSPITTQLEKMTPNLLEQFSERVYSQNWQNSGNLLPFADALARLRTIVGELQDAEQQDVVSEMPRSLVSTITSRLTNINAHITNCINGANTVGPFSDEVDRLHLDLWQGGFRYRGSKVLGYEQKYAEISRLSKLAEEATARNRELDSVLSRANEQLSAAKSSNEQITTLLQNSREKNSEVKQIAASAIETNQSLSSQVAEIQTKANNASKSASEAEGRSQSAVTHERRLSAFVEKVNATEKRMDESVESATNSLESLTVQAAEFEAKRQADISDMLVRLSDVEKDISDKLSKATGITLFHSFEKHGEQIKGHWVWLAVAATVVIASLVIASQLLQGVETISTALWMKLGIGLPVAVFVGFALQQYGRERRLKEEYAFKSAISLSLEAYRKLVDEAVEKLTPDEKIRFADFLIKSISTIYDSPTDKVFGEPKHKNLPTDTKVIASTLELAQKVKDLVVPK